MMCRRSVRLGLGAFLGCMGLFVGGSAQAEWVSLSGSIPESDIRLVETDPKDAAFLYAATERRLYRSADKGQVWKRVLSLRSSADVIHAIYVDPDEPMHIFVATEKGIRHSRDRGTKWELLFQGSGSKAGSVLCMTTHPRKRSDLLVGTSAGLLTIDKSTGSVEPVSGGFPRAGVHFLWSDKQATVFASTTKGLWKSIDFGGSWTSVHSFVENEEPAENSLRQFQIEELSAAPMLANIVKLPDNRVFAATHKGLLGGSLDQAGFKFTTGSLPTQRIHYLAASDRSIFAATDKGVFARASDQSEFKNLSDGLGSLNVASLHFDAKNNHLYAATEKGLYRFIYPDLKRTQDPKKEAVLLSADEVLQHFAGEPTVQEIQKEAIRYAEVHPEKISAWRSAAARKAIWPTVSLDTDMARDENIDLDRGGTNDPDRFIAGPIEESVDWSIGASWDLGEIVWNNDQTSIDTRSKLMVELRDDVLTEVTHLYYERRRLQVELLLTPPVDLALAVEKKIKLEELTAGIDGLTGGYLSKRIGVANE